MIYLDNSATTPIDPEVLEVMLPYLKEEFGNPSSRHYTLAKNAEKAVEDARLQVASLINAKSDEIIFTAGASESNNFILKGVADYKKYYEKSGNHIITSSVEHKSVLQTCKFLNGEVYDNKDKAKASSRFVKLKTPAIPKVDRGFEVDFLNVNEFGQVESETFINAIKENTILASFMWGNNEIGSLNNIKELSKLAKDRNLLFHSDATQVLGKIDIDVRTTDVDFLSFSAHKIYGPKGVGATFIKRNTILRPNITSLIHGGLQEDGFRAGTHSVHNIVGFGKACELAKKNMNEYIQHINKLEIELKKLLKAKYPDVKILGDENNHIPGVVGFILPNVINEMLIKSLKDEIAISSGSACGIDEPSYVIKAIGQSDLTSNFLRVSLSKFNTIEDLKL